MHDNVPWQQQHQHINSINASTFYSFYPTTIIELYHRWMLQAFPSDNGLVNNALDSDSFHSSVLFSKYRMLQVYSDYTKGLS